MYKVLFAEDELLVRIGLQNAIKWSDYSMELVAQADDGGQAFELFQKIRPDVVITDIRMDVMDGHELIRKIREIDKECAIIVISCIDDFEVIRRLVPLKINGYVLKATLNMEEINKLLQEIREYLISIGRNGEDKPDNENFLEKRLKKYLLGEGSEPIWNESEKMKYLCRFSLKAEDRDKINESAVKFINELLSHQFKEGVTLMFEKPVNFYIFLPLDNENLEKRVERVNELVESFLGIRLSYTNSVRQSREKILDWFTRHEKSGDDVNNSASWDNSIKTAIDYINANHGEQLSLAKVAGVAGVSPTYFSALFKKEIGKNYVEYLNEVRLKAVLKEFKVSDAKISFIAEKHGFPSQEYFSRYFKKVMGVSPAKWRRKNS